MSSLITGSTFVPKDEQERELERKLEEDIIFGRFAPGSRLIEDVLMARYGAKRHAVRKALSRLERVGIVQIIKNIGATVKSYSREEVEQIYFVRELLVRSATLMIQIPIGSEAIREIEVLQEQYESHVNEGNLRAIHQVNDAFHLRIFEECRNLYLVRSIKEYMGLTLPMRAKSLATSQGLSTSVSHHRLIIELLKGKDIWALSQINIQHLSASKEDYISNIKT